MKDIDRTKIADLITSELVGQVEQLSPSFSEGGQVLTGLSTLSPAELELAREEASRNMAEAMIVRFCISILEAQRAKEKN